MNCIILICILDVQRKLTAIAIQGQRTEPIGVVDRTKQKKKNRFYN